VTGRSIGTRVFQIIIAEGFVIDGLGPKD
jgi:hypothetical protein